MRMIPTDIGHSGELHKLYAEYAKDTKTNIPEPTFWFIKFRDPMFFCLLAKHGRKPVGFVMGRMEPYYETPRAVIEAVFVRRGFRGKLKFIRSLSKDCKQFLKDMKIATIAYTRSKVKERTLG